MDNTDEIEQLKWELVKLKATLEETERYAAAYRNALLTLGVTDKNLFVMIRYYRVMSLLRATKMEHGQCQPRSRKACTHCNAKDELDKLLAEYKGPPIAAQPHRVVVTEEMADALIKLDEEG